MTDSVQAGVDARSGVRRSRHRKRRFGWHRFAGPDSVTGRAARVVAAGLIAGTFWPAGNLCAQGGPWTLESALETAAANSPQGRIAQHRVAAAESVLREARAAYYPQLSLTAGYMQTNSPMLAFGAILNQRSFSPGVDFNDPGTIDNLNAAGNVVYNLYSGGRRRAGVQAAESARLAARHDEQAAMRDLAVQTVVAFLEVVKAKEAVTVASSGVEAFTSAVDTARARHEAGDLLRADLLSLEVRLAEARERLVAARHGRLIAGKALLFVLGLEARIDAADVADDDPAVEQIVVPNSSDFPSRPELASIQERVKAAEALVIAARGAGKPAVNAFASYQYDHGWELGHGADSWAAGISVDYRLFDGGTSAARLRRSEIELRSAMELLRNATLGIGLEVEQSRLTHSEALERMAVTALAVAQAEESAELTRARFERGGLLTSELIAVESRLIEARVRRVFAEVDERIAAVRLRRALGLDPVESFTSSEQETAQ